MSDERTPDEWESWAADEWVMAPMTRSKHRVFKTLLVVGMGIMLVAGTAATTISLRREMTTTTLVQVQVPVGALTSARLASAGKSVLPSVVDVVSSLGLQHVQGAGTGVIVSSSGLVVTNNHVIDGATSVSVRSVTSGRTWTATVLGYDRSKDVAVLQLHGARGLIPAHLVSEVHIGEAVIGIGNAGGVGGRPASVVGRVTSLGQEVEATSAITGSTETLRGLISTNADIVPGDSGGPMVNTSGDVVGLDTAASVGTGPLGGYAVSAGVVNQVLRVVASRHSSGTTHVGTTAFLGILTNPKHPGVSGVRVASVVPRSAAANVLVPGDTLTWLGDARVRGVNALSNAIVALRPGETVVLRWLHDGMTHQRSVRLGRGPAQ